MPRRIPKNVINWLVRSSLLLVLFALSILAISPLFAPGYFYSAHDGRHSVFYLTQFDASIRDWALWPRWAMHHTQGYGYPTFIIQAPIGFYLAELFVLLGAGYTLAAKFSWAIASSVGGWGLYWLVTDWLRRYSGTSLNNDDAYPEAEPLFIRFSALVAALIYIFIPYHLLGMYVRAALNDTLLLAWFPWVVLAFDRLIDGGINPGWPQRLVMAAFCLGGILLTHTFALISFTPLLITFVLFRLGLRLGQRHIVATIALAASAGVAALLLYANFLLPLLFEGSPYLQEQVYVANTYDFRRHFVYWGQFLSPFWGFGFSDDPKGAMDGMGFQIGALAALFAILWVYLRMNAVKGVQAYTKHANQGDTNRDADSSLLDAYSLYLLLISLGLLFVITPSAAPLWESFSPLSVIQFPWRLLSLTAFTLSTLAGLAIFRLCSSWYPYRVDTAQEEQRTAGLIMLALLAIFGSYSYINANLEAVEPWREDGRAIVFFEREHPDMMGYTKWVDGQIVESPMTANYLDEAYGEDYSNNGLLDRLMFVTGSGEIISRYSRGSSMGGVVQADEPSTIRVLVYHFPGWQVRINGLPVEHTISTNEGLIEVQVPTGQHQIDARFGATAIRRAGTIISWTTLLLLVGLLLYSRQGRKNPH